MRCIVCDREIRPYGKEECPSCKRMLDEKYRGDPEGRELSRRYFKWLKGQGGKKHEK